LDKELDDDDGIHELSGYVPTLEEAQLEEPMYPRIPRWMARLCIQMPELSPALEARLPPLPASPGSVIAVVVCDYFIARRCYFFLFLSYFFSFSFLIFLFSIT